MKPQTDDRALSTIVYSIIFLALLLLGMPLIMKFLDTVLGKVVYVAFSFGVILMIRKLIKILE